MSVRRNFANHYSVLANYTYSKSIDIATDVQLTSTPQDYLDPTAIARSGTTIFVTGSCSRFLAKVRQSGRSSRNFKLSLLNTVQSPRYFSILAGFDVNGDGFPFSDRTGTVGRNSYRGASYYDTDVRLQRVFSLGERLKATASMEAFNLLNHVNVQNIDQVYGAADFLAQCPPSLATTSAVLPTPPSELQIRQPRPATAGIRAFQLLRRESTEPKGGGRVPQVA